MLRKDWNSDVYSLPDWKKCCFRMPCRSTPGKNWKKKEDYFMWSSRGPSKSCGSPMQIPAISLVHWFKMNQAGSSMNCRKISLIEVLQVVARGISKAVILAAHRMLMKECNVRQEQAMLILEPGIFKSLNRQNHLMWLLNLQIKQRSMFHQQTLPRVIPPGYRPDKK